VSDTPGQMHPHYRTAVKAAAVAAAGLAAAVFAAADPAGAKKAGIVAGCVAVYAGARWGAKKLGLRGSLRGLRVPSLRRAPGGGSRGRSLSPFKRSSGGKAFPGGSRRGGGLLRGRSGIGGGSGKGKLFPSLRRGSGKGGTGTGAKAGRGGGLLRRGGGSGAAGAGSPATRRRLNPFRRPGRKGTAAGTPGGGSRKRFMPGAGKRSGGSRAGRRLGGMAKAATSPFRRSGRSTGGRPGAGRPGIFKRRGRAAGKSSGRGVSRRGTGGGTPKRAAGSAAGRGRPGGVAAGLARYAKFSPKRKLGRWQKAALGAGKLAGAPLALAWLGSRWAWRKTRKNPQPDPEPVPKAVVRPGKEKPADKPVPSAAPEEPGRLPARLHNFTEGPTIMNHIDAATEAAQSHIGGWEPENAADLDMFLASLPAYFDGVAGAFRTVAAKLADGYPVHPDVPDRLNEIASTIGGMADFSGEAHAVHRSQHQQELERLENPRPGEKFWDVTAQ